VLIFAIPIAFSGKQKPTGITSLRRKIPSSSHRLLKLGHQPSAGLYHRGGAASLCWHSGHSRQEAPGLGTGGAASADNAGAVIEGGRPEALRGCGRSSRQPVFSSGSGSGSVVFRSGSPRWFFRPAPLGHIFEGHRRHGTGSQGLPPRFGFNHPHGFLLLARGTQCCIVNMRSLFAVFLFYS
jgi:hypothetical protein